MHHDGGQYLPGRLALLPAARYYVPDLTKRPDDFAQSPDHDRGRSGRRFPARRCRRSHGHLVCE